MMQLQPHGEATMNSKPSGNKAPGFVRNPGHRVDLVPEGRQRLHAVYHGVTVADSGNVLIVKETGYDPVPYFPRGDVRMELLERSNHHSHCPFKGEASYWSLASDSHRAENAAWSYEHPYDEMLGLKDYVAFYRSKVDIISSDPDAKG